MCKTLYLEFSGPGTWTPRMDELHNKSRAGLHQQNGHQPCHHRKDKANPRNAWRRRAIQSLHQLFLQETGLPEWGRWHRILQHQKHGHRLSERHRGRGRGQRLQEPTKRTKSRGLRVPSGKMSAWELKEACGSFPHLEHPSIINDNEWIPRIRNLDQAERSSFTLVISSEPNHDLEMCKNLRNHDVCLVHCII